MISSAMADEGANQRGGLARALRCQGEEEAAPGEGQGKDKGNEKGGDKGNEKGGDKSKGLGKGEVVFSDNEDEIVVDESFWPEPTVVSPFIVGKGKGLSKGGDKGNEKCGGKSKGKEKGGDKRKREEKGSDTGKGEEKDKGKEKGGDKSKGKGKGGDKSKGDEGRVSADVILAEEDQALLRAGVAGGQILFHEDSSDDDEGELCHQLTAGQGLAVADWDAMPLGEPSRILLGVSLGPGDQEEVQRSLPGTIEVPGLPGTASQLRQIQAGAHEAVVLGQCEEVL